MTVIVWAASLTVAAEWAGERVVELRSTPDTLSPGAVASPGFETACAPPGLPSLYGVVTCVVPSSNSTVIVERASSSPETLADSSGPGAETPLTLVGSMSTEKVNVSPGSKSVNSTRNASYPSSASPSWGLRNVWLD